MYGVRGMTSSRVPATRPGRPRPGDAAKRVTAARIRSIMPLAAVGLFAATCSQMSSSGQNSGEHIRGGERSPWLQEPVIPLLGLLLGQKSALVQLLYSIL